MENQTNFILENKPDVLIVDGPMTYMLGYRYSHESLKASIENLIKIIEETLVKTIILEHHLMRDLKYKEKILPVVKEGEKNGVKVISAAEFLGKPIEMLEARRKELYQKYPEVGSGKKFGTFGE
jgi:predicted metallo-beta-lactamase superfamily hydrolase